MQPELVFLGTTPGKFLLNIHFSLKDDKKIKFTQALSRSFKVWWRGLGIGIPIITLGTLITCYKNLKKMGETHWDRNGGFVVEHGEISLVRVILVVFLFIITIGLSVPLYQNVGQRIDYDLGLNEGFKKQFQDLPKMIDELTRLDRVEAYDGEIYYKHSILLDDDQKINYSIVEQVVKKNACSNEGIISFLEEPTLRLINNEGRVHYHYIEEMSNKITKFSIEKSDCL